MRHRKSDILWKVIIDEIFADMLRFLFKDADQVYDMERGFEFLEQELAELDPQPGEEKDTRFADKVVKVYHRDGKQGWIVLHIEVQGKTSNPSNFSERMFRYFYRLRDRHKGAPVSAIAIFTGPNGRNMPGCYIYQYRNTKIIYKYPTVSIVDFSDEELAKSDNPFAHVVRAAKTALLEKQIPEEELLKLKLNIARELFRKGFSKEKTAAIYTFLKNYILFDNEEMDRQFDNELKLNNKNNNAMKMIDFLKMEAREEGLEEGWMKGRQQGIAEKEHDMIETLVRTTDFSDERIATIVNVSESFVKAVRQMNSPTGNVLSGVA